MGMFVSLRDDEGSASVLIFRVATGLVAVLVVTTLESQLLTRVFGDVTALLSAAVGR